MLFQLRFTARPMRSFVYIDAFNVYYRLLKDRPQFKWLDLRALCKAVLRAENDITRINYYTARVSGRLDPEAPARQQIYLDALRTIPEISIYMGNFLITKPWAGLVHPPQTRPWTKCDPPWPRTVRVWRTEEKGSDVNLGCHLVRDACQGAFDVAAVLSNDTDLVEPIRIATEDLGLVVGLITPVSKPAASLQDVASFVRHIRLSHLQKSQFAQTIQGTGISRPAAWSADR